MKVKGIMTQMSGSVGGWTGSHNRGGLYFRGRAIPVNPNTAAQQRARTDFAIGVGAWAALTVAQRTAWNVYAAEQAWTDTLGDAIQLSGQQAFVASTSALLAAGLAQVTEPPVPNTRPEAVPITLWAIEDDAGAWSTNLAPTAFPGAATDRVLVSIGRPIGPGRLYYGGPYRIGTSALGNAASNASAEAALAAVLGSNASVYVGTKIPIRLRLVRPDGAYSAFSDRVSLLVSPA